MIECIAIRPAFPPCRLKLAASQPKGEAMRSVPSKPETLLLLACACLMAAALLGPAITQPAGYHDFADQRVLWGLPFAMDVLSNLPFAIAGAGRALVAGRGPAARLEQCATGHGGPVLRRPAADGWRLDLVPLAARRRGPRHRSRRDGRRICRPAGAGGRGPRERACRRPARLDGPAVVADRHQGLVVDRQRIALGGAAIRRDGA